MVAWSLRRKGFETTTQKHGRIGEKEREGWQIEFKSNSICSCVSYLGSPQSKGCEKLSG
jgi:hypothetical protein